jgi:hypothetical protein
MTVTAQPPNRKHRYTVQILKADQSQVQHLVTAKSKDAARARVVRAYADTQITVVSVNA